MNYQVGGHKNPAIKAIGGLNLQNIIATLNCGDKIGRAFWLLSLIHQVCRPKFSSKYQFQTRCRHVR